ncbi:hypothetical protein NFI96_003722, partial [Prochilodus magdalenae]
MMGVLFTLWLFGTVKTSDITELQVQAMRRGDDTTIRCGQKAELKELVWYKERLGKLPQYVVRKVITGANSSPGSKSGIYHKFNPGVNHSRFSVDEEKFDLSIKGVKEEDIGIYYCGNEELRSLKFISGTLLLFAEEKTDHHPPPEPDKHQCSVQTVTLSCSGEHSVYWIRHGSGEPHPGIIYTPRYTSDECENSSETDSSTQSCVYKLPKRNLSLSDAGTYYCAVAACGPETKSTGKGNNWTVVALIMSNAVSVIVMLVLGGLLWKKQQKGSTSGQQGNPINEVEDTEGLNYATVNIVQRPPSRSPRVKESQDIYSQVKVKPALICEKHKAPVADLPILVFCGKCQSSSTVLAMKASDIAELQVQTVRRGDDTTIRCGQKAELKELAWYKESLGKLPQYVVRKVITGANSSPGSKSGIYYRYNPGVNIDRFSVDEEKFDLSIKGVKEEDIGIYLCGNEELRSLKFISGTLLLFAEEKTDHHPPPEPDKHQCSVQTVTLSCSGEHSVYWIRHGSGEPHPGIIYTPPYTSDECENSSETDSSTQSCVYKLPKRNLSLSDAGTYYCAVAACGPETKSTGK